MINDKFIANVCFIINNINTHKIEYTLIYLIYMKSYTHRCILLYSELNINSAFCFKKDWRI